MTHFDWHPLFYIIGFLSAPTGIVALVELILKYRARGKRIATLEQSRDEWRDRFWARRENEDDEYRDMVHDLEQRLVSWQRHCAANHIERPLEIKEFTEKPEIAF
jgi:hypothetical protein